MNEEKNISCDAKVAPEVTRTQEMAWRLMFVGVVLGAISQRLLFLEPLLAMVAAVVAVPLANAKLLLMAKRSPKVATCWASIRPMSLNRAAANSTLPMAVKLQLRSKSSEE